MAFEVLVIGDIILDQYYYVDSIRKAQEADIPIWDIQRKETRLGGAANVAANLASLGKHNVNVYLCGITDSKFIYSSLFYNLDNIRTYYVVESSDYTLTKTRYVSNENIIFRCDNAKKVSQYGIDKHFQDRIRSSYRKKWDAVIVSDYDKGTIDDVSLCFDAKLKVVDSKRKNLNVFSGFDVLKVNENEFNIQLANKENYENFEELFKHVVVTKGKKGADLRNTTRINNSYRLDVQSFPVKKVLQKDVTGCGDTHTAALTYSLLLDSDINKAVKFANVCASSVVQKFGTSIYKEEK